MIGITRINATITPDETGARVELPVLLTEHGVLMTLVDYCVQLHLQRSLAWMEKLLKVVRRLIEYIDANPSQKDSHLLLSNFRIALHTGTFDPVAGNDPSNLGWSALSNGEADVLLLMLSGFIDYLVEKNPGIENPFLNKAYGTCDIWLARAAYLKRKNAAMLGHAWPESPERVLRPGGSSMRATEKAEAEVSDVQAFPEDQFANLIFKGFNVGRRWNYRDMLITILLHGAGFRESEVFHLYTADIIPDPLNPRSAVVLIHHPSNGAAPADWRDENGRQKKGKRREYLAQKFGLKPRNLKLSTLHAGWKGGMLEKEYGSSFMRANWFEPEYGELFMTIWLLYMKQTIGIERNHPYAFINLLRGIKGEQYKLGKFIEAHEAAVLRIGLPVGKLHGTHRHGHRHAYGKRLANAAVPPVLIKRLMHHSRLESQDVYTKMSADSLIEQLRCAAERIAQKQSQKLLKTCAENFS